MLEIAHAVDSYHSRSEDRVEIIHRGQCAVIVVADGVGGRAEAAEFVIHEVKVALAKLTLPCEPVDWCSLLCDIDGALADDAQAGETTIVIAAVSANGINGASVGDSVAWLITSGGYDDLTERQERKPFLGSGAAWPVAFQTRKLEGTLLVATDGLTKFTSPESICAVACEAEIEAAVHHLIELVRPPSGKLPDDIAVALCRLSINHQESQGEQKGLARVSNLFRKFKQ
ncbi:MAG: SpoIIE family protein phosphatase [Abitibacteriaceae bacterium]|nr:SpoIIE family protein phosphatase [Abditibacteriaceae bacterium]